ncbi:MAG: pilus assembly protein PilY, partial [Curvibacter sp.]|nr:pilus assembly protein PilY [Curvibacter sp.]
MKNATTFCSLIVLSLLCARAQAQGQYTISDNFTGATSSLQWYTFGGACLTAGSGVWTGTNGPNYLPGCSVSSTNNYYTQQGVSLSSLGGGYNGSMPDTAGNGAMRLTNNSNYETGAIVSNNTMSTGSGLNISFVTTTYGGNGADGMTFFLMDGSKTPTPSYNGNSVGASGGSLGYSCSNGNPVFDGVYGAYVGIGMDEYGNFQNGGSGADNTNSGYGFHSNTVAVRGAGNISWKWLNANWPSYYPSTLTASQIANVVHQTCANNSLYNAGGRNANNPVAVSGMPAYSDYPLLPPQIGTFFQPLPSTMWTNTSSRSSATPIAYQVIITPDNKLSVYYSFNGGTPQTVLNNLSITASNGPIPSTLRFGFAGSTGGLNNMHEVSCFKAQPQSQSSSSVGTSAPNSGNLQTNTQEYVATYSAVNWSGHFSSYGLNYNTSTNILSFNTSATWDASCVLTGNVGPQNAASSGTCYNTGAALTTPPTPATGRVMLTSNWSSSSNASVGTAFQYGSLPSTQQSALGSSNKLSFLRGDRSLEQVTSNGTTTGTYRARTDASGNSNVLGDIMDSSAALLTYPQAPYLGIWTDYLNNALTTPVALIESASGAQTYAAYVKAQQTRQNVVFIGSNDGFLHGFSAGAYNSSGTFQTTTNTGQELIAYMPGNVLNAYSTNSGTVGDFSNPTYSHVYSADGQPTVGDLFYNKAWHTWLVSGQGPGGSAIFALDVTNPGNFAETNAASLVLGEWNASTITCVGNTTCGTHLGNTYGTPQIRRFHSNQWGFIFGNGYGSAGYTAGIYIGLVNASTGAVTFYYLDTGKGSSS